MLIAGCQTVSKIGKQFNIIITAFRCVSLFLKKESYFKILCSGILQNKYGSYSHYFFLILQSRFNTTSSHFSFFPFPCNFPFTIQRYVYGNNLPCFLCAEHISNLASRQYRLSTVKSNLDKQPRQSLRMQSLRARSSAVTIGTLCKIYLG